LYFQSKEKKEVSLVKKLSYPAASWAARFVLGRMFLKLWAELEHLGLHTSVLEQMMMISQIPM